MEREKGHAMPGKMGGRLNLVKGYCTKRVDGNEEVGVVCELESDFLPICMEMLAQKKNSLSSSSWTLWPFSHG
jgi:hypothetical protein